MERDRTYFERALIGLRTAAERSRAETDPEAAMRHITRLVGEVTGDREAAARPDALKPGERDFTVCGMFFVAPARDHLILLAEHGFPAEQRRQRISIADSRPGHAARTGQPDVVPNTDTDPMYRQILKTARMGSALYAPLAWGGTVLGLIAMGAQARGTYDRADLNVALPFANLAAATWMALDGPRWLARVVDALPPWRDPAADSANSLNRR